VAVALFLMPCLYLLFTRRRGSLRRAPQSAPIKSPDTP